MQRDWVHELPTSNDLILTLFGQSLLLLIPPSILAFFLSFFSSNFIFKFSSKNFTFKSFFTFISNLWHAVWLYDFIILKSRDICMFHLIKLTMHIIIYDWFWSAKCLRKWSTLLHVKNSNLAYSCLYSIVINNIVGS